MTVRLWGKNTEIVALSELVELNEGFIIPNSQQKKLIVQAFVMKDKIVYGKIQSVKNRSRRNCLNGYKKYRI